MDKLWICSAASVVNVHFFRGIKKVFQVQQKQDWKTSVLKPEDKTVMTENGCFCDFYVFYDFYDFYEF